MHFLDEVPYPLARAEARDLRNLLSTAIYSSTEIVEVLRTTGVRLDLVRLDKAARHIWSDVLRLASTSNPKGGARAFVEQLVASASELGIDAIAERLSAYLRDIPPPAPAGNLIAAPPASRLQRVLGMRSAFVDVVSLPPVVDAARSVVRIQASFARGSMYGTGFLIGERRVLTNHHVLHDGDEAARAVQVWFDYEPDATGNVEMRDGLVADAGSIRGVVADDIGVFDLPASVPARAPLAFAREPVRVEAKVAIVQHPQGLPKQVAFHTVVAVKEGLVHYLTDTEPGSSGSPVLNRRGEVVALHHASKDVNVAGTQIAVNEGIAAERVLAALEGLRT